MVPSGLDDGKMNIDELDVMKLLNKFYEEREIQQVTKSCESGPQVMTLVTGESL